MQGKHFAEERSNCLACQEQSSLLGAGRLLGLPPFLVLHQRVQDRQQRAPTGGQGNFGGLACSPQAFRAGFEHRLGPHRDPCPPGQSRADGGPPSPPRAAPTQWAAVAVARGHADQGRQPGAAPGPALGQLQPPRAATDGAHAGPTAEPRLRRAPAGAHPSRGIPGVVQRRPPGRQPGDRRLASALEPGGHGPAGAGRRSAWRRDAGAARAAHGGPPPAPPAQAGAAAGRRRRQGPRPARRAQPWWPRGLGKSPRRAGLDPRHRPPSGGEGGDHRPLLAPRGGKATEGGLDGLEPRHQGGTSRRSRGHGPAGARGAQGHGELGWGAIKANEKRRGSPHALLTEPTW